MVESSPASAADGAAASAAVAVLSLVPPPLMLLPSVPSVGWVPAALILSGWSLELSAEVGGIGDENGCTRTPSSYPRAPRSHHGRAQEHTRVEMIKTDFSTSFHEDIIQDR